MQVRCARCGQHGAVLCMLWLAAVTVASVHRSALHAALRMGRQCACCGWALLRLPPSPWPGPDFCHAVSAPCAAACGWRTCLSQLATPATTLAASLPRCSGALSMTPWQPCSLPRFPHAVAGGGAFLNGQPIRVSETAELKKAVIATGAHYCQPRCSSGPASRRRWRHAQLALKSGWQATSTFLVRS